MSSTRRPTRQARAAGGKAPALRGATGKATPHKRPATTGAAKKPAAPKDAPRLGLEEVMAALEEAGSAQARKTYARHGAREPMFGVSFATLGKLVKAIRVDHELAMQLWATRNYDARNLALKIVDPDRMRPVDLDRWARDMTVRMCAGYVSMVACEGPHAFETAVRWLASDDVRLRDAGWGLVAQLALRDPDVPDAWLADRLAVIVEGIDRAPDSERYVMNNALIAIGCRSAALEKAAQAAAQAIGTVEVDHGDTWCKTPDARAALGKAWAHASAKGFATPALQEQARKSPRTRC